MATYSDMLAQKLKAGKPQARPAKLSKEEQDVIVKEALERIDQCWQHEKDNRREASLDLRFLAGDQWPMSVRMARVADNRPTPTINVLPQFVRQVTNDIRQADLAVKVSPVDSNSDPKLAKIYNGILKQIHYRSSAKTAYVAGCEHQATCGIGWWRITHDYVEDDAFDQELRIEGVTNPLAVYCDPASVKRDRSDAAWMALTEMVPRKTFEKRWPKAKTESIHVSSDTNTEGFFWLTPDDVRIAEYYRKVPVLKTIALLPDGEVIDITDKDQAALAQLPIQQTREVTSHRVEHYLISGGEVLDGPNRLPGKYIPLIPVIGAEIPLEKQTYRHGLVRFARDPQQLMNFYRAATTEAIALAPRAPYLVTPTQIGKYKQQWDSANTTQRPYLLYNPDKDAPGVKPQREAMSEVPQALIGQAEIANEDIKRVTGIYDASLGQHSNETSGIAIRNRQTEGDVANYHYADNFRASLEHTGRVLIDLIPEIYDNERIIRMIGDDDKEEFVPINHVLMGVNGIPIMLNDLSAATFDVRVSIGPSYTSKRQEATASMTEFVKSLPPELQAISVDLIAKGSDWPGSEQLAKRFKNLIQANQPAVLADPDDPNAPKPPNPADDPKEQGQMQLLMAKIAEIHAKITETQAKVESTKADALDKRADAIGKLVAANVAHGESMQVTEPNITPAGALAAQNPHPLLPPMAPAGMPPRPGMVPPGGPPPGMPMAPPPGPPGAPPPPMQPHPAGPAGVPPQPLAGPPIGLVPPPPPPRRAAKPPPGFKGGSLSIQ